MKKVNDLHTAINKSSQATSFWLPLLQWLRLLELSLTRIKIFRPGIVFYEPAIPSENDILLETPTQTETLKTTKLTSMNPAYRYIKWGVMLLFAFLTKFATAQTGPFQFTGDDNVCMGQTKSYGVTNVAGSTYSWTITPGSEGVDWNLTISNNTITVKWLKSGTYSISVVETNSDNCSGDAVQIQVTVYELPVCSITGNDNVCPGSTNTYSAPAGMSMYNWSITGNATIPGATNGQTVSVVANNTCGSYTLTLVITNTNGCTSTCEKTFEITDTQAPSVTGTIVPTPVEGCDVSAAPNAETNVAGLETIGLNISDNCTSDANLIVSHSDVVSGTCELSITRTYTITDACGNASTVQQVINIKKPDFTLPVNGASTVNCAANATLPTAPTVKDACGNDITPTVVAPNPIACNGTMVYTFTYKDCAGHSHDWTYTYTIDAPDFTLPVNGASTVNCAANATLPTAPTVKDACGNDITPTVVAPNPIACNGTMVYTFTYKDCAGHSHDWTYTYTIDAPDFTLPVNGASTVNCAANATLPTAPTVKDACGNDITPTVVAPNPIACNGTMVYTFTYKDCAGHSHDWTYTYTIDAPDFTLPVNGASTVNCAANATLPTAPPVKDACGNDITPTVVAPNPIACNGTMVYTFTYKDCAGHSHDWTYTYTIDAPDFTLPVNGASTVNCAANATLPTAPPVKDACGNDITPTVVAPNPIACNGTMVYTFTYKDCAGHSHDWTYTYTIDAPDFTLPVNGASTVNCAANATLPTAPPVKDACGNDITPTVVAPNPIACNGTMVYTFTYKDCAGHSHDWTYTYTIDAPDFTLPVNGASTVNCAANATLPTAPPVKDACGNDITPTVVAPNPIACNGTMVYTFTYKDCAGHSHDWTYTYTIDAPDFTLPVNGASNSELCCECDTADSTASEGCMR